MITRIRYGLFVGLLAALVSHAAQLSASDTARGSESKLSFKEQEAAIYQRMRRHGVNREEIKAFRDLYETNPPYSFPHVMTSANEVLNPGEHLRIEMDEFIATMKIPDAPAMSITSRIWPYNNTRNPDPAMQKYLEQQKGALKVAAMGWENCNFLGCMNRRGDVSGMTMTYRILKPEEITGMFSTPERLQQASRDLQKFFIVLFNYNSCRIS